MTQNQAANHLARKRFGQNFLQDGLVIDRIIAAVGVQPHDRVVEIGPGLGALTQRLIGAQQHAAGVSLHAIEIDRDLAQYWRTEIAAGRAGALQLHEADALQFDYVALSQQLGGKLRLVGNLPYNISTPLLFQFQAAIHCVQDQHFMLQREVVDRMVAKAGSGDFSRLSVMLQATYAMSRVLDVPPEAFDPPPKVHSAVVRMLPLAQPLVPPELWTIFAQVVALAFSQRRKMLRGVLKDYLPELEAAGIAPTARAQEIGVLQFKALAELVAQR